MADVDTQTVLNVVEILKGVKSLLGQQNPYLPVYSALGGAFVGAVATFIPNSMIALCKERRERKSLTLALYAEIQAVTELIRARAYVENIRNIINDMHKWAHCKRYISNYSARGILHDL